MTATERREIAQQLSAAIRAGNLREVQRLLDVLDGKPDQQNDEQPRGDDTTARA